MLTSFDRLRQLQSGFLILLAWHKTTAVTINFNFVHINYRNLCGVTFLKSLTKTLVVGLPKLEIGVCDSNVS